MEHAIGTRITLEVVESSCDCSDCFFNATNGCDCNKPFQYYCSAWYRTDGKNIIYKEIKED